MDWGKQFLWTDSGIQMGGQGQLLWTDLGIGWLNYGRELYRTPLGGFINHSDKPNVQKIEVDGKFYVQTLKDIKKGEEITLKYTLYKV